MCISIIFQSKKLVPGRLATFLSYQPKLTTTTCLSPFVRHTIIDTMRCTNTGEVVFVALLSIQTSKRPPSHSSNEPEFMHHLPDDTSRQERNDDLSHTQRLFSTFSIDRQLFPSVRRDAYFESLADAGSLCRSWYSACLTINDIILAYHLLVRGWRCFF